MSNAIKYSTSQQSLALKKGNFWIGTGDVGKGSTDITDYWNGITPPISGYTIYLNKSSQGPSIYLPQNDNQLIDITNQIVGTSFTSSTQCLNYYNTQNDKMVLNIDYPPIVTNGLVLNLDAGFTPSYSTSGTTWYDISSSTNNGTLINGTTFNSSNGGNLVFDGVNDYVDLPSTTGLNFSNLSFTINIIFKLNRWDRTWQALIAKGDNTWRVHRNSSTNFLSFGTTGISNTDTLTQTIINSGVWYNVTCIYNIVSKKIYINGVIDVDINVTGTLGSNNLNVFIGENSGARGRYFNGSIALIQIYNRALTSAEVLQNYNATRSRYGL